MVEHNPPVWMQSGTYQASDDRMITGLLVDRNIDVDGNFISVEGGVVPPYDQLKVSAPGGAMTFTVSAGIVFVPSAGSPPGAYVCYNDGVYNGTVPAESSANPRIDLLVARVTDQAMSSDATTSSWQFALVTGASGANPITPDWNHNNEIPIASIKVIPAIANGGNKITNAQITDLRTFVASNGGVHRKWGAGPLPTQSPGRLAYDATQKKMLLSDGAKFDPLFTLSDWKKYTAAYRPLSASFNAPTQMITKDVWDPTPLLSSKTTTSIAYIQRTDLITPSGQARVSLLGLGKVSEAGATARVSVVIRDGTTDLFKPSGSRAMSFYTTGWQQSSAYFIVRDLPVDKEIAIRVMFFLGDTQKDDSTAYFSSILLQVEAVL